MTPPFFPSLTFAWFFVAVLWGGLAIAAWIDSATLKIPRKLSMGLLAAGILLNLIRGAWLGALGWPVWVTGETGLALGLVDGGLFAVAGLVVGFAVFFVMWVMKIAGGGDVKIAAAVGAWLGPMTFLLALLFASFALFAIVVVRLGVRVIAGQMPTPEAAIPAPAGNRGFLGRRLSFSLPLAVGTLLAVVGTMAPELRLVAPIAPTPPVATVARQ